MALINENVLLASADKLRGSVAPSDYIHITLGFIFLKYISDRFEEKYKALVKEGEGFENDKDEYMADHILGVPEKSRWEYVASFSKQEEIERKHNK